MQNQVLVICSAAVFIAGLLFFIVGLFLNEKYKKKVKYAPFSGLVAGTVLAVFFLYMKGNLNAEGGVLDGLLVAVLGCIRALTGENSVWDTRAQVADIPSRFVPLFSIYTAVLHFSASSVVIGIALNLVNKFFPMIRFRIFSRGSMHVFSGISERSLLLAEDIRRLESEHDINKSVIVFLYQDNEQGQDKEQKEQLKNLGAYSFEMDVRNLPIPYGCDEQRIDYWMLKENDEENLEETLRLVQKYEDESEQIYVHVLSNNQEVTCILDSIVAKTKEKKGCSLRLITEERIMLYQLIDCKPLFLGAKDNKISILIVGAGRCGKEAMKVCSWCGRMFKHELEIWIVDQSELPYRQLLKECPETMKEDIHFEQLDVTTDEFVTFLRLHPEFGYVICTIGDDHLNLQAAMDIRSVFYENPPYDADSKKLPYINVLLNDSDLCHVVDDLKFEKKIDCNLHAFGNLKEFYTWENLGASYLEGGGLAVHRFYSELFGGQLTKEEVVEDYRRYEYNRASSMATALHGKYKLYSIWDKVLKTEKSDEDWSVHPDKNDCQALADYFFDISLPVKERLERVEELSKLEHTRWNAYVRSQGWRTMSKEQRKALGKDKNVAAKLHADLVDWEELPYTVQGYDRKMIWMLPFILLDAYNYDDLLKERYKGRKSLRTDDGVYTYKDFEAILYWNDNPVQANETIRISGTKLEVSAYLRQALLLNIFSDEEKPTYEICCDEDIEKEFAHVIKQSGEKVSFLKNGEVPKDDLEIIRFGKVSPLPAKDIRVMELRDSLIDKAQSINDYYRSQFGGRQWQELDAFKKGSNICAAAYIERHRRAFMSGMESDAMGEVEHERWCRYHYVHGWRYSEKRDDRNKYHNCLIPYYALSEVEKDKDKNNISLGLRML